jgi:hypothetical protein
MPSPDSFIGRPKTRASYPRGSLGRQLKHIIVGTVTARRSVDSRSIEADSLSAAL